MSSDIEGMARVLRDHTQILAFEGPARCMGCDWESRQIGISSTTQHLTHQAKMLAAAGYGSKHDAWEQAMDAVAEQGTIQVPDNPYKETP